VQDYKRIHYYYCVEVAQSHDSWNPEETVMVPMFQCNSFFSCNNKATINQPIQFVRGLELATKDA
jgi:hypothetical protein